MPKAILELEMPESCLNCPCIAIDVWGKPKCRIIHTINGLADALSSGRRSDCPLKLVEEKEEVTDKQTNPCQTCYFDWKDYCTPEKRSECRKGKQNEQT